MCEECERGDTLAVVYSRKLDRRGWRPPAKAKTVARHTSKTVTPDDRAASFACAPSKSVRRREEIG